ncbi:hypothetical protein RJ639_005324 [Escallonia herrerae]|uniref:Small auxin up regulated protein n=1 Tax=Escallonia herrerae TaxID=1293975 RepID=A0AA89AUV1_9ASTE|nr:hypothetical protein RJ639_005324 [Escallonia herrerae]
MISPKKLIKMARMWQKLAAIGHKRVTLRRNTRSRDAARCNKSSTVNKGHFVVYTADERRFVIPLDYLKNVVFIELLKLAKEMYGLPMGGPITLPCDAGFMEYAISFIKRHPAEDMEKALLMSITSDRCVSSSCNQLGQISEQLLISSF